MTHILIKNVGPIKNVELDLNKINVFMGPQSSGKSTIAKIISYCSWFEKNYILAAKPLRDFYSELIEYHNLEDAYFDDESFIEYKSKNCHIIFLGSDKKKVQITTTVDTDNVFKNEKIEYIPAERNVVSIPGIGQYTESKNNILGFLYDWFRVKRKKKEDEKFYLPLSSLNNVAYYYIQEDDIDKLVLDNGKEIKLQHASSGLISVTPLVMVFNYIIKEIYSEERTQSPFETINIESKVELFDKDIRDSVGTIINQIKETKTKVNAAKDRIAKISVNQGVIPEGIIPEIEKLKNELAVLERLTDISQDEFVKSMGYIADYCYSKVIIEEPELNLFPKAQQELVYYMLSELNASQRNHQLVLTTHSPYILFALNNCMMGKLVEKNIPKDVFESVAEHRASWISPKEVGIYEIEDGKIRCIQDEDGIIEDNYLNKAYKENSAEYLSLLNYFEDEE